MNNFTFGDPGMGYYETIAGGAGAGPGWHGRRCAGGRGARSRQGAGWQPLAGGAGRAPDTRAALTCSTQSSAQEHTNHTNSSAADCSSTHTAWFNTPACLTHPAAHTPPATATPPAATALQRRAQLHDQLPDPTRPPPPPPPPRCSGVHTHMTNTRITDPEILERRYPVVLKQFMLRPGDLTHAWVGGWLGGRVREMPSCGAAAGHAARGRGRRDHRSAVQSPSAAASVRPSAAPSAHSQPARSASSYAAPPCRHSFPRRHRRGPHLGLSNPTRPSRHTPTLVSSFPSLHPQAAAVRGGTVAATAWRESWSSSAPSPPPSCRSAAPCGPLACWAGSPGRLG